MTALDGIMGSVLRLLHRATETGGVSFYGSDRYTGFPVESSDLDGADLSGAAYCTINQFKIVTSVDPVTEWETQETERRSRYANFLCAAHAHVSKEPSAERLAELEAREIIPKPSIIVRAGSGATLLWLLCDKIERDRPPKARDGRRETLPLYRRIQRGLNERMAREFGAEPHEATVSDLVHIPSSYVQWEVMGQEPCYWTLSELCRFLRIPEPRRRQSAGKAKARKRGAAKDPARVDAPRALAARRIGQLLKLIELRGTLAEREGREAVRLLSMWAAKAGLSREEVIRAAGMLNSEASESPLHIGALRERVEDSIRASRRQSGRVADQTIADLLGVTPDEAKVTGWPCASRFRTAESFVPPLSDTEKRQRILRDLGRQPTIREWQEILGQRGIAVSRSTAARDLRTIL